MQGEAPHRLLLSLGRVRSSTHPVYRDSHLRNNKLNPTGSCARHRSKSINQCNSHEEMLSHFIDGEIGARKRSGSCQVHIASDWRVGAGTQDQALPFSGTGPSLHLLCRGFWGRVVPVGLWCLVGRGRFLHTSWGLSDSSSLACPPLGISAPLWLSPSHRPSFPNSQAGVHFLQL